MDLKRYFFANGIRFKCQQCGKCCTGEPGTVYVTEEEIKKISDFLNIDTKKFKKDFLYPFRDSYSIKELKNGNCVFYKDKSCAIYPVRPMQCRTYPFWLKNLRNEKNWKEIERQCPGIGKGKLFTVEEIIDIISKSPI
ncbi:YkgJ family cysteine cluster protein [Desulfothermus okinawensis JCM 13304]